jgi:hypothetical protein
VDGDWVKALKEEVDGECVDADVVLRRKSWVMAMPMEAKARDVRSQAKNVRSVHAISTFLIVSL